MNETSSESRTIIGDGVRNDLSLTIARATPCEVRFGLFLAQNAPSLHNKIRALIANLRLYLDKLIGPWHFQMPVLSKNSRKMIYQILMFFFSSVKLSRLNELDRSF